jgi:hypothetical protein
MSPEPLRMYSLTRPLMWLAVVGLRAAPLLAVLIWSRHGEVSWGIWGAACAASLLLQAVFFFVERRCSSTEMPYHHGLLIASASVSTGWTYFDLFLVFAAVSVSQLASCGFALTGNAAARYRSLAHWFYRNRVER